MSVIEIPKRFVPGTLGASGPEKYNHRLHRAPEDGAIFRLTATGVTIRIQSKRFRQASEKATQTAPHDVGAGGMVSNRRCAPKWKTDVSTRRLEARACHLSCRRSRRLLPSLLRRRLDASRLRAGRTRGSVGLSDPSARDGKPPRGGL